MKIAILIAASLVVQRALGWPGLPLWASDVLLPMAFVVALPMLHHRLRWTFVGIAMGIGWDVMMEPVIGPGGIAWSAAFMSVSAAVAVIADRKARAWAVMGSLGALVMVLSRFLALLPLGLATPLDLAHIMRTVTLTAAWCGLFGWLIRLDLPTRWRAYRARTLR